jgi:very-short-patch-repair endonuclease
MSLPEVLLWRELRQRPAGLKFRKQHSSGPYTADFFCHEARLVVEVDGEAHDRGDRPQRDAARDAWFAERGFNVLRLPAVEVLSDLEAVVLGIIEAAGRTPASSIAPSLTPLRQASPATSPLGGGLE